MRFNLRNLSCVAACVVALAAWSLSSIDTVAQDPPPAPGKAAADPFKVPAGNDAEKLKEFVVQLMNSVPTDAAPAEFKAFLNKSAVAFGEVLKREIPEALYLETAQAHLEILFMRTMVGVENAEKEYQAQVAVLRKHTLPAVRKMSRDVDIGLRTLNLAGLMPAERQSLLDELHTILKEAKDEQRDEISFAVSNLMEITQSMERIDSAVALASYEQLAKNMNARADEKFKKFAGLVEPRIGRLSLPGKVVEFTSTTLDGKPFDLKQLRGKVVVVDFWATWCGPCIEDFPHLAKLYEGYKDKGLEIVGINLDDDKETVQKFLEKNKLPWMMLFDDKDGKGFESALPVKFGIFSTPTTWLIDRDGKMVELSAHGPILDKHLEKLLGPLPVTAKDPEIPSVPAKPN